MKFGLLGLLAVGLVAGAIQDAQAASYGSIYVFGDDYSDGGNAYATTSGLWPPPPYYSGRFSNGPTAVDTMAAHLGVSLSPSSAGGTNFAIGGAATGQVPIPPSGVTSTNNVFTISGSPIAELFDGHGIDAEVDSFLASGVAFDPATALFVVWGGANDLFINPTPAVASQAIANLAARVVALHAAGARNFLVPNMLDLSLTPVGREQTPENQMGLHLLTLGFNAGLAQAMDQLALLPAMNLMRFDTFGFLNAAIADPAAYGFTNVTEHCFDGIAVCDQPEEYLFWDGVNPTSRAHQLLGEEFVTVVAGPDPGALLQQLATDVTGVGPGTSLADKVALAQTYYTVSDIPATCAVLTDFVSQVGSLTHGKKPKLPTELASELIADAEAIMTAIGCN